MISLDNIRHYVQDAFITGPLLQKNLDGLQIIGTSGELQGSETIIMLRVDIYLRLARRGGRWQHPHGPPRNHIQRCFVIIPIPLVDVSLLPSHELLHRGVA